LALAVLAAALAAAAAFAQDEYVPENEMPAPAPAPAAPQAKPSRPPAIQPPPAPAAPTTVAVLQGLDKVTARISTIDAPIGTAVHFGTLEIVPHACSKMPPEEAPESAVFLEIAEVKPGEPRKELFTGWMFASSPALSALEHPVYDVWVLDCKTASSAPSGKSP
jgi:hypothetical protein